MLRKGITFLLFTILFMVSGMAQTQIKGVVLDPDTKSPVLNAQVSVQGSYAVALTNNLGEFTLNNVPEGEQTLLITADDFIELTKTVTVVANEVNDIGNLEFKERVTANTDEDSAIPIVSLNTEDVGELSNDDVSGILTASRDLFVNTAGFTWGARRYRIRGYNSEDITTSINGVAMNDLENGRVFWGAWGGLNDVVRNQDISIGLKPVDYTFGGIGGAVNIDMRASSQRVQKRFVYSLANRSYTNRIMATYSTGMRPNGWALSLSASKRWAKEGFIDGTFYDANSFYGSVDKKINEAHSFNLTAIAAHRHTGSRNSSTQEMNDLAGTNYYNSNWGYQNGKKRNSRVRRSLQPIFILSHNWNINEKSMLRTGISVQDGYNGGTALDWYETSDPRPDYYRKLPSYVEDPIAAAQVGEVLSSDEAARQLDWESFYQVNRNNQTTLTGVSNVDGGTITGNRSSYIIEDRRYDSRKINFNTNYNLFVNDQLTFTAGYTYNYYKGSYFKEVVDLLGGDFYLDIDKFAERDFIGEGDDIIQNDLDNPNRAVTEGDRFGYDYDPNIRKSTLWAQTQYSLPKFDFGLGLEGGTTQFWRVGNMRNGKFPDSSFGESEKQSFTNYGVKGNIDFKIDGRNYISANSTIRTRAPFFRNSYVSPRTRDEVVPDLKNTKIFSSDIGYFHKSPKFKVKALAYYSTFKDESQVISFYHDDERSFVNFIMNGIDREHLGVELAASAKLTTTLTAHAVAGIGQYIYTSRPEVTVSQDNNAALISAEDIVYMKNFYVSGTPQRAYNFGLTYRSPKFYTVYLNASYLSDAWLEFNPLRRTSAAVDGVDPKSETFSQIINQTKGNGAFMLDLSVTKSFRFGPYRLNLNFMVNNLLDVQDFVTGGYEQRRFDFVNRDIERFQNRNFYAQGRNFFANVAFSF